MGPEYVYGGRDYRRKRRLKIMIRKLYVLFGIGVIGLYSIGAFSGWELANSGRNSSIGLPFFSGYRGGK